jgi:predicted transcriptional regulator
MTVGELAKLLDLEVLTGDTNITREVTSGYTSDLLSDVIANVEENSVWVTIQRHVNILGVAKLKDVSAILIPRKLQLDVEVIGRAKDEGIALLRGSQSAFDLSGRIYAALHKDSAG